MRKKIGELDLNKILLEIKDKVYDKCLLQITDFKVENESTDYDGCQFELNGVYVICRNAKITPKKNGQFVTFWRRNENRQTEPFNDADNFNYYIVNVRADNKLGQFVFPKSEMIKQGIVSSDSKVGKRAIRVYPPWDEAKSKQAENTQKWQIKYFYRIDYALDLEKVKKLYKIN